jgi:hypothetical protein
LISSGSSALIRGTSCCQRESRSGLAWREIEVSGELRKSTKLFTRVERLKKGGYLYYIDICETLVLLPLAFGRGAGGGRHLAGIFLPSSI